MINHTLLKSFGFSRVHVDQYLEQFHWTYTTFVDTSDPVFTKRVFTFFSK